VILENTQNSTLPDRVGQSWEDIIRFADTHTLCVQHWLASRAPNAVTFNGLGTRVASTGLKIRLLNQALGARYPVDTPPETIHAEINQIKVFFDERGVGEWYWWFGPFSSPPNILDLLKLQGLEYDGTGLPCMVAPLPCKQIPAIHLDITVWQAQTLADLRAASFIRRTAFRFPTGEALTYFEDMPDTWLGETTPARLFLARSGNGEPAAIGALIIAEGVPGVYVMATLPDRGRRGLGAAILARIMEDATQQGHKMIVLTASRYGFGLYQKFGFEHIFDYTICRHL
jgi:GNAT superfamily N-acetyltransferase